MSGGATHSVSQRQMLQSALACPPTVVLVAEEARCVRREATARLTSVIRLVTDTQATLLIIQASRRGRRQRGMLEVKSPANGTLQPLPMPVARSDLRGTPAGDMDAEDHLQDDAATNAEAEQEDDPEHGSASIERETQSNPSTETRWTLVGLDGKERNPSRC